MTRDSRIAINNLPHLKHFRRRLRKNLTPAEATLWNYVKGSKIDGRKFRRQHSVGDYILDFYCPSERLGVELDGGVDYNDWAREYDYERTLFLNSFDIKIIRFENRMVYEEIEFVIDRITACFGWREETGL